MTTKTTPTPQPAQTLAEQIDRYEREYARLQNTLQYILAETMQICILDRMAEVNYELAALRHQQQEADE